MSKVHIQIQNPEKEQNTIMRLDMARNIGDVRKHALYNFIIMNLK